jgi:nucleotide-binding universal stress UspA family protein
MATPEPGITVERILFPVEFHEKSVAIVKVAAGIARRFHSELLFLHVRSREESAGPDDPNRWARTDGDLVSQFVRYAETELQQKIGEELNGLKLRSSAREGEPAQQIAAAARQEAINLIVMPTRSYRGFYQYLIESVTAEVMHQTDRPVLAAAHLDAVPRELSLKRVLCGVTFSEHSQTVLNCAARIAREFGAKLTIAHVTPDVEMYGPGGDYVDRRWKEELVLSAQELVATLRKQTGIEGDFAVESGDPGAGLNRIAQQVEADLLVAGCHNSGGHFGTNSYGILAESRIPVLSL